MAKRGKRPAEIEVTTAGDKERKFVEAFPAAEPPEPQKPPRKIAIVGKATSSMMLAPYGDDTWEIWCLSDCWRYIPKDDKGQPRLDRSFELHHYETGCHRWKKEYTDWLKANSKKLVVRDAHPDLPGAMVYPWATVLEKFQPYFTNSVSWMLALAMLEGCSEIGVYGVDMAQSDPATGRNGEYEHQRPSCEYFIGLAQGIGIKVSIPPQSDLLKARLLYAYQTHMGDGVVWHQARLQELANRKSAIQAEKRKLRRLLRDADRNEARMQGAMEDTDYLSRSAPGNVFIPPKME